MSNVPTSRRRLQVENVRTKEFADPIIPHELAFTLSNTATPHPPPPDDTQAQTIAMLRAEIDSLKGHTHPEGAATRDHEHRGYVDAISIIRKLCTGTIPDADIVVGGAAHRKLLEVLMIVDEAVSKETR